MGEIEFKHSIESSIRAFLSGSISQNALNLFAKLGYKTDRQNPFIEKTFRFFKESFLEPDTSFNKAKARVDDWKSIDLLFQLTQEELSDQQTIFDTKKVNNTIIETYLFFAIELNKTDYSRSALAQITREINKIFPMPVMLLFKYGEHLTLSVINRRLNKKDEQKDVLEKVTLIKDISTQNPHRAHIEILFDLSFDELRRLHKFTNFVELHNAWQKTLDTKELNKIFYQKLFNWYLWALKHVKFPQIRPKSDVINENLHQSESLIRLITRLLFVWFMKEKGLVNSDLFDIEKLKTILKDFKGVNGETTIYYKGILQNLFFSTLNKPIKERKVIDKGFNPKEYGDPLVYRYDELFLEPDNLLEHFKDIPFLNGGIFECLDQKKDNDNPIEIRLDGFSTKTYKQAVLPDKLFFGKYENVDLSGDYNDKRKKNLTVFGIIDILNQYKFTIEENTPIEEEIALDPELLGKVFENLLASYNPETKTTARKQTGSFYTPREIVNYMVDESLVAYLKNHINDEARIRKLFSLSNENINNPFTKTETVILLKAIDNCKVLDPACGSGAFPMGILHKMIHILHKLDPENELWLEIVVNNVPKYLQSEFRIRLKKENWNYVRKLGIIQQCIYGVDIQPIATQIAKLRFFISLLVDQTEKPNEPNRGIEPLPNLDFKIVTANTLISAPQSEEITTGLFENQTDLFFEKYNEFTYHYFNTSKPEEKIELRRKITALITKKIEMNIKQTESNFKTALDSRYNQVIEKKNKKIIEKKEREISLWQSYKNLFKHESVGFFEPRYFFPMAIDGFDVVIGNPPYIKEYVNKNAFDGLRDSPYYMGKMDIWYIFACNGIDLLKNKGVLTFIAQNNWVTSYGAKKLRNKVLSDSKILQLLDFGDYKIFENTGIQTMIMIFQKDNNACSYKYDYRKLYFSDDVSFEDVLDLLEKNKNDYVEYLSPRIKKDDLIDNLITFGNDDTEILLNKIAKSSNFKLDIHKEVAQGIVYPQDFLNKKNQEILGKSFQVGQGIFVLSDEEKNSIPFTNQELELIKPEYTTKELFKYYVKPKNKNWVIYTDSSFKNPNKIEKYPNIKKHLDKFKKVITSDNKPYGLHRARDDRFFIGEKIIAVRKCAEPTFTYVDFDSYVSATFYVIKSMRINLKFLTVILNSRLIAFWLKLKGKMQGNNYQIDKEPLLSIPICNPSLEKKQSFISIFDRILAIAQSDDYLQSPVKQAKIKEYEKQIDQMVYTLYNLTKEEIEIVEGT